MRGREKASTAKKEALSIRARNTNYATATGGGSYIKTAAKSRLALTYAFPFTTTSPAEEG